MIPLTTLLTGYLIMLLLSYQFSVYLCQLHDNDLWFSEIMVSVKLGCCLPLKQQKSPSITFRFINCRVQFYFYLNIFRRSREKYLSELSKDYIILISNNWCIQRACLLVSKTFNVITRLNQDTPSIFYRGQSNS